MRDGDAQNGFRGRGLDVTVAREALVLRRSTDHDILTCPMNVAHHTDGEVAGLIQRRGAAHRDVITIHTGFSLNDQATVTFLREDAALSTCIFKGERHQLPEQTTHLHLHRDGMCHLDNGGHVHSDTFCRAIRFSRDHTTRRRE